MLTAIFTPYDSLYEGSSCGFITTSMNGIVSIGCNQLFPYFNTLSILNIIISVILFILMILTYFLTTRYQFYEYLDGDFENYGKDKKDYAEADSSRNYNQELITANTGRYWLLKILLITIIMFQIYIQDVVFAQAAKYVIIASNAH